MLIFLCAKHAENIWHHVKVMIFGQMIISYVFKLSSLKLTVNLSDVLIR